MSEASTNLASSPEEATPAPIDEHVLLTGATGFLGREILLRLLDRCPGALVTVLVRGRDEQDAQARVEQLLAGSAHQDRVRAVRADLTQERAGLGQSAWDRLVATTTQVIHGAASVSFGWSLERSRQVNVEGTRQMLDLARAAGVRMDYISTTFVAGERRDLVLEPELARGQSFRNSYEQSKFEAEQLVAQRMGEQPIAVLAPSIIVGDSQTGKTTSFKTIYWPLKVYARGIWRTAPGRDDTRADIVPVDFVAEAVLHLREQEAALGRRLHLAAGPARDSSMGDIAAMAAAYFDQPPPVLIPPDIYVRYVRPLLELVARGRVRKVLQRGRVLIPYFDMAMRFDTREADALLAPAGIAPPKVSDYMLNVFRYARATNFGGSASSSDV